MSPMPGVLEKATLREFQSGQITNMKKERNKNELHLLIHSS
jgi:hypothetical protein